MLIWGIAHVYHMCISTTSCVQTFQPVYYLCHKLDFTSPLYFRMENPQCHAELVCLGAWQLPSSNFGTRTFQPLFWPNVTSWSVSYQVINSSLQAESLSFVFSLTTFHPLHPYLRPPMLPRRWLNQIKYNLFPIFPCLDLLTQPPKLIPDTIDILSTFFASSRTASTQVNTLAR